MRETSELYRQLLADESHIVEVKAAIGGVEYWQDDILSLSTFGGLFKDLSVGNCPSREIELSFLPKQEPPRMASIAVSIRLVSGVRVSEWLPKGVYFIDTRSVDEVSGVITIHGYDAMLKAERVWLDATLEAGDWPMSQEAAAVDIANRMGVSLDPRTVINPAYRVEYPNDYTMREVLGFIAAAHAGNWVITDEGKLLLVPLSLPPETYFLVDDQDGSTILFGEVRIVV